MWLCVEKRVADLVFLLFVLDLKLEVRNREVTDVFLFTGMIMTAITGESRE
jgi:hypothetical protein